METKDFFITPIVLSIIYVAAYLIRPLVTVASTKRYFIPGLTIKIIGAIAVGLIYQFYYGGGDTFTYFTFGSKYICEAFQDRPMAALKLIFAGTDYVPDTFQYASKIYTYGDLSSYFVVRVAGLLDILTFHTYSATASLFAVISFSGLWALFHTFFKMYPRQHFGIAVAVLFIPSVFFWGSGILKDTITLGSLGWATFGIYNLTIAKKQIIPSSLILALSLYTIYIVKIYILLCFLPAAILWLFSSRISKLRNIVLKLMIAPLLLIASGFIGYYTVLKVGEDNSRYDINKLGNTAKVTAEWIHYVSEREGGSAYMLGDFDYSPMGMISKFPQAVWVSLYRPHLWEVNNVVMLLSALESLALLIFTIYVFYKVGVGKVFTLILAKPLLLFCFSFSIVFAFAVGISTYNFGSLVRYKIPLLPYFVTGLFILLSYAKSDKKRLELAETE